MSDDSVFQKEKEFLDSARAVLENDADDANPLHAPYTELLDNYRKLLKQTNRLVRISDRTQLELRELNEMKNRFVGMAAHDLRNPCSLINGFSDLMLSTSDMAEEERSEYVGIINQVSANMIKLLGDLLDVSAIESGRLTMDPKVGDLGALVAERAQLLTMMAEKKGITIDIRMGDLPDVLFDADRMGQVIDNLIGNAIKFSESETVITVSSTVGDSEVSFAVEDQGPGLQQEDQEKLFGTFQKLSNKPTGGEKSSGLGLAIVKKIVTTHRGRITVESEVGVGSTFTVSIPV